MDAITSIEIYRVHMPLSYPFRTAIGDNDAIESVLVRLATRGCYGWGEAAPWSLPSYSPEYAAGVFMVIRDVLAPALLGQVVESGKDMQDRLAWVKGNPFAKAALDLACWDLHARSQNMPLWRLLGGNRNVVDVGADFGIMESIDRLIETVGAALQAGYARVKLKYRPGWELEMVDAVRRAFPEATIHVDCNSAYTLEDLPMFEALDNYNLAMIEQPLMHDDLIDHAELQRHLQTPICLDESITSPNKARKAIQIGACRWINIKPGRVGGLTLALDIHNLCQEAGIPCWIGGMLESALGSAHCIALATLPNIRYPSDIFPSDRFYKVDISTPPITLCGPSQVSVPAGPGVGAEPDPILLPRFTIERAMLKE
jgi:O-succinylbenzoate synthase